jgi:negative regulator of sigma E activity
MPSTKATFSLALCAALLGAPWTAAAQGAQNANALLRASIEAPQHLSYAGQLESVQFGTSKSEASIYSIEHRAPDLTRRTYIAPQALYGDWIVTRGTQTYSVDVKKHRVIVANNAVLDDQIALDDNFGLLTANYRAVLGPSESIAGRTAVVLLLMNRYTGQMAMRLWLDKETHLVLERVNYASNGSVTHQMRFDQIRYTRDLPGAIFSQPTLAGYATSRGLDHGSPSNNISSVVQTAGFTARAPRYLPEGFSPVAGDVSEIKGVRTLHLLYSDGIRTISLFENARGAAADLSRFKTVSAKVSAHDAQYVEDGPTRLLTWTEESGLHYELVGELSQKEMERIAASVEP